MEKLEDHIDEPIKKCVVGLNLLGIQTEMSCCGFTYEGEKTRKTHLPKSYIYVNCKNQNFELSLLVRLAMQSRWVMDFSSLSNSWCDFYCKGWDRDHPWGDPNSPHFHEVFNIGINRLEQAIDLYSHNFHPSATISDGNKGYIETSKIKHWQYKPTEPWIVNPEIYRSL